MAPSKGRQRIAATANIKRDIHDLARDFFGGDAVRTELSASGRNLKSAAHKPGLDADRS